MPANKAIIHLLKEKLDNTYQAFHRCMFGTSGEYSPAIWLWVLWGLITIIRLVPATYSLWEDPLWCLVTKINTSWIVTLGFTNFDVDHILYGTISKLIIKATHHHWIEFTYRIPSLIAGFLLLPLGFAVFSRISGRFCGTLFSLCTVFLPTFTLYADDARGYIILVFTIIWAVGLTPGLCDRFRPFRLGTAYFLIGVSHGLGLILLGCFALFGCFSGKNKPAHRILVFNLLLTLPAFVYNIPMIAKMIALGKSRVPQGGDTLQHAFAFVPKWIEYQFGTPLVPYLSVIFLLLMAIGVLVTIKRSWTTGLFLIVLGSFLPVLFGITHMSYTLERYSMCCIPFWLWALCAGVTAIAERVSAVRNSQRYVLIGFCALLFSTAPVLADYIRYPQQDYRGTYQTILREYPGQKTIFGFSSDYSVGLGFYARQYGLTFVPLDSLEQLTGPAWIQAPLRCVIVPSEVAVKPEMLRWLKQHSVTARVFKGTALPTWLYVLGNDAPSPN